MRLEQRICKLEKKKAAADSIRFAIVGVPKDREDIFKVAEEFWIKESINHRVGKVVSALPWPHYSGNKVKFLGIGTKDDVYFGYCGGVRDPEIGRFVFFEEVEDLIKSHWQEVQRYMNSNSKQKGDLSLSDEAIKIMLCMIR